MWLGYSAGAGRTPSPTGRRACARAPESPCHVATRRKGGARGPWSRPITPESGSRLLVPPGALAPRAGAHPTGNRSKRRTSLRVFSGAVILGLMNEVTRILSALEQGEPHAAAQLLPLVYDELRKLAAEKL